MANASFTRRQAIGAISAIAGASGLSAASAAEPVKLAYLAPLTGRLESYGKLQKVVVDTAIRAINEGGGIGGASVQLAVEDTAFSPSQAVERFRKVIERDHAVAVLGPYGSREVDVVAPLAVRLGVPVVSTIFTKVGVPAQNRPWLFRIGSNDEQVLDFGVHRYRELFRRARKAAVLGNVGEAYIAAMLRDLLPAALKREGFELVDTVEITPGQVDFTAPITRLARSSADLCLVLAFGPELVGAAKEISRRDEFKGTAIGGFQAPWSGPVLALNPQTLEGWYSIGFFDPRSPRPAVRDFVARMQGTPESATALKSVTQEAGTYDALIILAKILNAAQVTSTTPLEQARAAVRDGLTALRNYPGVAGTLTINAQGDTEGLEFKAFRAVRGVWVPV